MKACVLSLKEDDLNLNSASEDVKKELLRLNKVDNSSFGIGEGTSRKGYSVRI